MAAWMSHTVPFSHIVPSYPERQVHWFGRAHLMKINNNNKFVSDIEEEAKGKYIKTIMILVIVELTDCLLGS